MDKIALGISLVALVLVLLVIALWAFSGRRTGNKGPSGPAGKEGDKGPSTGSVGPQGLQGPAGAEGVQGPPGDNADLITTDTFHYDARNLSASGIQSGGILPADVAPNRIYNLTNVGNNIIVDLKFSAKFDVGKSLGFYYNRTSGSRYNITFTSKDYKMYSTVSLFPPPVVIPDRIVPLNYTSTNTQMTWFTLNEKGVLIFNVLPTTN